MTQIDANKPREWHVGDHAKISRTIHYAEIVSFSRLSGDDNPIHLQKGMASFQRPALVQGAFLSALAAGLVGTKLPGPGTIYISQSFEYLLPVYAGETVVVSGIIRAKDDLTRRFQIDIQCHNNTSELVMTGTMLVMLPRRSRSKE